MRGDVGDFPRRRRAIVGGGAVLGATPGFIAGSVVHDFRRAADPERWAQIWGSLGGGAGLVVLVAER
jgi:hypothetical protein